tara:strand:- start:869 stop:1543 length:675 start_codon:yes stop_codon:yes gene_type:complete
MKKSKRSLENKQKAGFKAASLDKGLDILASAKSAKFDESVDLHILLSIDPKQADQQIRGTMLLPHGTGDSPLIAVVADGKNAEEAKSAGAQKVGGKDLIDEIKSGKLDFDVLLAHPSMMRDLAPLGRVLGPRGLMPSPKAGTVSSDMKGTVSEFLKGKQSFRNDDGGNVHLKVGKKSFKKKELLENIQMAHDTIKSMRPSSVKGTYMKKVSLSLTMGPGVKVEI